MLGPEEEEFLEANSRAFLLMRRGDGSPTGYPMLAIFRDHGLEFSTYAKSAKVQRLHRDPRVCCLVTSHDRTRDRRVLSLRGTAEVRSDRDLGNPPPAQAGSTPPVPDEVVAAATERTRSGKRVVIRIVPDAAAFLDS